MTKPYIAPQLTLDKKDLCYTLIMLEFEFFIPLVIHVISLISI